MPIAQASAGKRWRGALSSECMTCQLQSLCFFCSWPIFVVVVVIRTFRHWALPRALGSVNNSCVQRLPSGCLPPVCPAPEGCERGGPGWSRGHEPKWEARGGLSPAAESVRGTALSRTRCATRLAMGGRSRGLAAAGLGPAVGMIGGCPCRAFGPATEADEFPAKWNTPHNTQRTTHSTHHSTHSA